MPSAFLREQSLHVERPLPWALCMKDCQGNGRRLFESCRVLAAANEDCLPPEGGSLFGGCSFGVRNAEKHHSRPQGRQSQQMANSGTMHDQAIARCRRHNQWFKSPFGLGRLASPAAP